MFLFIQDTMQKKNNDNILLFSTEKRARFDDNF